MVQSIAQGRRNAIANTSQGLPRLRRLIPAMSLGLLLSMLTLGGAAYANTITVNSLSDTGASGICVLRDAISAANTKAAVNGCAAGSGNDVIVFSSGLTGTIAIGSPLPDIVNTLTINGPAATPPAITLDGGGGSYRLLQVNAGATLNLDSLTFADSGGRAIANAGTTAVTNSTFSGNSAQGGLSGGAILNTGRLTITNSTFSGNSSPGFEAGAILNTSGGTMTVTDSTFSRNSAEFQGGAIFNDATLTVANSTFSGNSARFGGAIFNQVRATVINSTFAGNSASFIGGAISNEGTLTVANSTLSGNTASSFGGGVDNSSEATITFRGTILTASSNGNCSNTGTIINGGYNISDDATCGFGSSTGANGRTLGDNVNPNLDPAGLANNGGPTQTIALQAASAAVDAIPFAACTFPAGSLNPCTNPPAITSSNQLTCDQRGEPRPDPEDGANGACDIGAYELQSPTTTPFARFQASLFVDLPQFFLTQGSFALAAHSKPLDPTTQALTVTLSSKSLAPVTLTIPAGSFKKFFGQYVFRGNVDGVEVSALITAFRTNYGFLIEANGLNLTGISNPVTVKLQVDSAAGTKTVRALIL
jgi:predicted outer membrane repeat protein